MMAYTSYYDGKGICCAHLIILATVWLPVFPPCPITALRVRREKVSYDSQVVSTFAM
jgi:hypothetical protein